MFKNAYIPYRAYWSTPFAKWQGSLSNLHGLLFAAHVAKQEMAKRNIEASAFDHIVMGTTTPQMSAFNGAPWLASEIGNKQIGGPTINQVCATGTRSIVAAAQEVELGTADVALSICYDRISNSPVLLYPNPRNPDGVPDIEKYCLDNLAGTSGLVPFADVGMVVTAENCATRWTISTEEQHEVTLRRYEQYQQALANDHAFQKGYMTLPFEVPDPRFRKVEKTLEGDEGIYPTSAEKMATLKAVVPGGTVTLAAQTHPADGNAAVIVTTKDRAAELSADAGITIRIIAHGQGRHEEKYMPAAPVFAARQALERAGMQIGDIDCIKSHNPFAVNDIVFSRETGRDVATMNNYGCSLIWGHPNAATAMRSTVELIEELVIRGGGTGMFQGCAAGDIGMALIVKVEDNR